MLEDEVSGVMASSRARQIQYAGPAFGLLGLAIGYTTLSGLGQGVLSLLAASFFLAVNMIPDEASSLLVLGSVCGLLGCFMGCGLGGLSMADPRMPLFLVAVTLFHATEFAFSVLCHSKTIEFRCFLLAPVPAAGYSIAIVAAICEFWLWQAAGITLPGVLVGGLTLLGAGLVLAGWSLRTAALFTARSNFTHIVAHYKDPSHRLVQHGVYGWCRHPGYVGWFLWSVSTQILLINPVCIFCYSWVSFRFFAGRIPHEEEMLLQFFGDEYMAYAREVPCGIPGISRLQR
ncbi:icmt [Symbiodinium microadriaticum]|nr:icmt [Symbiodinium microadriaticum]CAE7382686.1 icmt [Symbiodinium sp. KB8]